MVQHNLKRRKRRLQNHQAFVIFLSTPSTQSRGINQEIPQKDEHVFRLYPIEVNVYLRELKQWEETKRLN